MSRDDRHLPPELRSALEPERDEETSSDWDAVWGLLGRAAPPDDALPDADDTWTGVQRHVEEGTDSEVDRRSGDRGPRRPAARRSARRRLWRWGSAVAVALVLVFTMWWWTQPVEVTAVPGSSVAHTLPDGSTVELNGDSRLSYPRTFASVSVLESERRIVRLHGEAYFDVASGDRPFIVRAPSVRVEVLSTEFSVRSRRGETDETHVALAEGRLRVTDRGTDSTKLTLNPGEAATLDPMGRLRTVRDTSINRILAWRYGGFAATARPLPSLARALERRFGRGIYLDASIDAEARSEPLTLYYSQGAELETILHDVCMARGLTYRATANGYVLAQADDTQSPGSP